jgi:toxin ParE1/3/4
MKRYRLTASAAQSVEDIHFYSMEKWGDEQADAYARGMADMFARIATGGSASRPIAADIGVDGSVTRYGKHMIYWRKQSDEMVVITAVLHERMDQVERLRRDSRFWDEPRGSD